MQPYSLQKYCNLIPANFYMVFIIILLHSALGTMKLEKKKEFGTSGKGMF